MRYPRGAVVDFDALIVGALLHDIAKTAEYDWTGGPIRIDTHEAALSYHTVSGGIFIERVWQQDRVALRRPASLSATSSTRNM